jgi:heat shock protein HslJ
MLRSVLFLLIGGLLLGLAGCSVSSSGDDDEYRALTGVRRHLERIEYIDRPPFEPSDNEGVYPYFVRFTKSGRLEGQNACNACSGTYEREENRALSLRSSCTEAACAIPAPNLSYGSLLGYVGRYEIEADRLRLYLQGYEGEAVLHHRAE